MAVSHHSGVGEGGEGGKGCPPPPHCLKRPDRSATVLSGKALEGALGTHPSHPPPNGPHGSNAPRFQTANFVKGHCVCNGPKWSAVDNWCVHLRVLAARMSGPAGLVTARSTQRSMFLSPAEKNRCRAQAPPSWWRGPGWWRWRSWRRSWVVAEVPPPRRIRNSLGWGHTRRRVTSTVHSSHPHSPANPLVTPVCVPP